MVMTVLVAAWSIIIDVASNMRGGGQEVLRSSSLVHRSRGGRKRKKQEPCEE